MFLTLKKYGHRIEEKYPGIYYVHDLPFPAQVVVIKQFSSATGKSLGDVNTILAGKKVELV